MAGLQLCVQTHATSECRGDSTSSPNADIPSTTSGVHRAFEQHARQLFCSHRCMQCSQQPLKLYTHLCKPSSALHPSSAPSSASHHTVPQTQHECPITIMTAAAWRTATHPSSRAVVGRKGEQLDMGVPAADLISPRAHHSSAQPPCRGMVQPDQPQAGLLRSLHIVVHQCCCSNAHADFSPPASQTQQFCQVVDGLGVFVCLVADVDG